MASDYVPERGDVIWLDFDPQAGHEQAGKRPALVLSPLAYNRKIGLALLCPITSQVKGYPFEVKMPAGHAIGGVVLSDQVKSMDWRIRGARFAGKAKPVLINEVLKRVEALLFPKNSDSE